MSGINFVGITRRSFEIFGAYPIMFIAIGLPSAIYHATSRMWWSPSVDLLAIVLSTLVSAVTGPALIYAAAKTYEGKTTPFIESYRKVLARLGAILELEVRYFGTVLLLTLTIIGIPFAIRTLVRWCFSTQALILHDVTPKQAISLSCQVVRGRWWQIAGTGLLVADALAIPWITTWTLLEGSSVLYVLITGTVLAATGPIVSIFWTLVFLQLHDRNEMKWTAQQEFQPA